ncbi:MAG: T9SS type A sorting domain-containing protein [Ferruginibacter sp.]
MKKYLFTKNKRHLIQSYLLILLMFCCEGAIAQWQSFRANLYIVQQDTQLMADGILVDYYSVFSNAVDYDDALKMYNGNENVGLRRDGSMLSIERRNTMGNKDTLYLNISGLRVQSYRWIFSGIDIAEAGRVAYLKDNFLGTSIPLNLAGSSTIDFSVTGNAATYAYNRFMIVFEQAGIVPVMFTSISASLNNNKSVIIKWHVENEIDIEKYEVEHSADARNFQMINKTFPSIIATSNYQVIDAYPLSADNYYRVKATSLGGLVQYSAIVKLKAIEKGAQILVYPTLISDKKINISFSSVEKTKYYIQVSNIAGQVVLTDNVMLNNNTMVKTVEMSSVPAGIYTVVIKNNHSIKAFYKIVVE